MICVVLVVFCLNVSCSGDVLVHTPCSFVSCKSRGGSRWKTEGCSERRRREGWGGPGAKPPGKSLATTPSILPEIFLTSSLQTANVILIINIWQMSYCKISNDFFAKTFCKHDEFFLARLERASIERNEMKEESFGTVESSTAAAESCLSLCKDLS